MNYQLLQNYHSMKNVMYFLDSSGNKVYLKILIYLFLSALMLQRYFYKNELYLSRASALPQLQAAGPEFKKRRERNFLTHCIIGSHTHFLPYEKKKNSLVYLEKKSLVLILQSSAECTETQSLYSCCRSGLIFRFEQPSLNSSTVSVVSLLCANFQVMVLSDKAEGICWWFCTAQLLQTFQSHSSSTYYIDNI